MKIVTPASYTKIFNITANTNGVSAHRGLLIVNTSTTTAGSVAMTFQDGSSQTVANIPPNTIFILPVVVKNIGTLTNTTIYGLL